jgi:hypothetical protein
MRFEKEDLKSEVEILKRPDFEAIPVTVADSLFTGDDTVVKAGTPLNADGTAIANSAECAGLLLHDVTKDNPNGALLKKAYVSKAKIKESFGSDIADAAIAALSMIVFE